MKLLRRMADRTGPDPSAAAPDEWLRLARAGDEGAFRALYERFARPILGFTTTMVGQADLAEDPTQETFIRAFAKLHSLRDPRKLDSWIFGVASNVCREALRARRVAGCRMPADSLERLPDRRPSPEGAVLDAEFRRAVADALDALDEEKRLVFVLKVLHGRSYRDIAEITGFSVPKLKTDLYRARAELRRRLEPQVRDR